MNILFIDFESYFDSANGYTLKKVSVLEYLKSEQFKLHGVGYMRAGERPRWIGGHNEVVAWAKSIDWSDTYVCAHNVKFDGAILTWVLGAKPKGFICTQAMSRAMLGYKVSGHSLAAVAEYFGFVPKGHMATDGIRDLTPEQEAALAEYCLHDVELCAQIHNMLATSFPAGQYRHLDWTARCFVEPALELDAPTLAELHKTEKARRIKIFEEIGIEKKVFSSNDQFSALLISRGYEVPFKKSPKQKNPNGTAKDIPALAVSDQAFLDMLNSGNDELVTLCEARVAAKSNLLETRSERFLRLSALGKFPFDVDFSGAKQTHRYSGAGGAGGNPQNLPRGSALRRAVRAPEGFKVVVADFAAIEARVVAWLAREPKLIDDFSAERDVYCAFASRIYQRPITKNDKRERQFGKTCILGLGYGMGAKKFEYKVRLDTKMVVDKEESKRVVTLYRVYYSRIPAFWGLLDHYIPFLANGGYVKLPGIPFLTVDKGAVILPSGLKLQYPNLRWDAQAEEWIYDKFDHGKLIKTNLYGGKLLENISQALAGEICKLAIERAEGVGLRCVGQVHDEIIAVVPAGEAEAAAEILRKSMEESPLWWPTLKLKAEAGIGPNWLEAKV